jgi:hypothetical protein
LKSDADALLITNQDFDQGKLKQDSNVRPNRLFTAEESIVIYRVGALKAAKLRDVIDKIIEILRR